MTARLTTDLAASRSSTRLAAAMAAGTEPAPELVAPLVDRCRVEPDFFVRDMLTWALTRQDASLVIPALLGELESESRQARSQALHTLSKIGAPLSVAGALLHDPDPEVARSAWRAAVVLIPESGRAGLATELAQELGRGGREEQLSLSRALVALGDAAAPALEAARVGGGDAVRAHADATARLMNDPEGGFAIDEARRAYNLKDAPIVGAPGQESA